MIGQTNGEGVAASFPQLVNHIMLYDQGNECVEITGGWVRGAYNCGSFTKNGNSLYATGVGNSQNYNNIATANMIDCSSYSLTGVSVSITNEYKDNNRYYCWWHAFVASELATSYGTINGLPSISKLVDDNSEELIGHVVPWVNKKKMLLAKPSPERLYVQLGYANYGFGGTYGVYMYNAFAAMPDDISELARIAKLPEPESLEALIADTEALTAVFASKRAVEFMCCQCTGDFMCSAIADDAVFALLQQSPYYTAVQSNEHWNRFIAMRL